MDDLKGMAAHAARRVERLKVSEPVDELRARPLYARAPRPFEPALEGAVADLRFADPERGLLVAGGGVSAAALAAAAVDAMREGAAGLAVWTERNFHAGDYPHLDAVRAACPDAPIVMMDYVVDPWQVERARAGGADAVLLIPELLGPFFERLRAACRALDLAAVAWDDDGPRLLP